MITRRLQCNILEIALKAIKKGLILWNEWWWVWILEPAEEMQKWRKTGRCRH